MSDSVVQLEQPELPGQPRTEEIRNPQSAIRNPLGTLTPLRSPGATPIFFLVIWLMLMISGRGTLLQDPGTFWHLVLGERLLSNGELCRHDTFTFTYDGQTWLSLQWLGEAAMAAAYRVGGWDTLLLLTCTVLAATYTWLASRLMRAGLHWLPTAVVTAVVVAASSHHFHARPHVATIAFLGLTIAWLCDVGSGRKSLRHLIWLVPLFALWTNIHGGVLGGIVTLAATAVAWLAYWLLGRGGPIRTWRDALALSAITLAALLSIHVNPYGPLMAEAWLRIMTMPLPDLIQEHRLLSLWQPEGWMVAVLAIMYGLLLWDAVIRHGAAWDARAAAWFLPLLWLVFAIQRVRHAPLFAIVAAVVMADLLPSTRLARWLAQWEMFSIGNKSSPPAASGICSRLDRAGAKKSARWLALPLLGAVVVGLQAGHVRVPLLGHGWARHDARRWPVELLPDLKVIEAGHPGARIFNTLDFGGFLAFHTPKLRTFIDDRCELFGTEFLAAYAGAELRQPERLDGWADEYGFAWALVRAGTPLDRHLRSSPRWRAVREAPAATLYRRAVGPTCRDSRIGDQLTSQGSNTDSTELARW